jgi:hypothetical protein
MFLSYAIMTCDVYVRKYIFYIERKYIILILYYFPFKILIVIKFDGNQINQN